MTYFPNHLRKRPLAALVSALSPVRDAMMRDIESGRLLFKPPALRVPAIAFEPLPIKAVSITHRPNRG